MMGVSVKYYSGRNCNFEVPCGMKIHVAVEGEDMMLRACVFRRALGLICLAALILWTFPAAAVPEGEEATEPASPSITIADDVGGAMVTEALRMGEDLQERAWSLFERSPLGFDLGTIDWLQRWALTLPLKLPDFVRHIHEQSRLLGFVGSMIMLAFLVALFYSLFGQQRVLGSLEGLVEPLRKTIPEIAYPYFLSALKVVTASLIPLILWGLYGLTHVLITYNAPWFQLLGRLFQLWAVGALLINLLRETLTRDILGIPENYGRPVFRVSRIVILYIIFSLAIFLGAETFQIPGDVLALLKFIISLSIVLASLFLILKKRAILGILPDLPYRSYEIFRRGLERFYFPAIFATFLTGLMWCFGYQRLCKVLWLRTWAVAGVFVGIMVLYHFLQRMLQTWDRKKGASNEAAHAFYGSIRTLLLYATVITTLLVTLDMLGLFDPIRRVISFPFLSIGQAAISVWTLLKMVLILLGFAFFSRLLKALLDYKVYPSVGVDEGLGYAINSFLGYVLLAIGFLVALRATGLDFRILMVFAGALGIGIGLGMQSMAANLIAGFSLIFGRRVRKGDWIQVGDHIGYVQEVSLRATKVRTRDNIEYLIPNADLISNTIVNYTLSDPLVRVHVPVGVTYSANPQEVEKILVDAAGRNPTVSERKKPAVWFTEYGDSSINFELLVWIDVRRISENQVASELYFDIFKALDAAGIEIPFPQRDLHIRSDRTKEAPVEKG